jgi:hypothetical protein
MSHWPATLRIMRTNRRVACARHRAATRRRIQKYREGKSDIVVSML